AAGLAGGRVDPGDRAVLAVGDPDGIRADRDPVWQAPDRDTPPRHLTGPRVDLVHGGIALVGDPDAAGPAGDGVRDVADLDRIDDPFGRGVDPGYRPVAAVGHPHVAAAGDGDRGRVVADRDLLRHRVGGRVDPRHGAVGAAHRPDRVGAECQAVRAADGHRSADPSPRRVDQADTVARQAGRPARPRPGGGDNAYGCGDRERRAHGPQGAGA